MDWETWVGRKEEEGAEKGTWEARAVERREREMGRREESRMMRCWRGCGGREREQHVAEHQVWLDASSVSLDALGICVVSGISVSYHPDAGAE
jgi:hypothetical protein